jgi:hypothetical protein
MRAANPTDPASAAQNATVGDQSARCGPWCAVCRREPSTTWARRRANTWETVRQALTVRDRMRKVHPAAREAGDWLVSTLIPDPSRRPIESRYGRRRRLGSDGDGAAR